VFIYSLIQVVKRNDKFTRYDLCEQNADIKSLGLLNETAQISNSSERKGYLLYGFLYSKSVSLLCKHLYHLLVSQCFKTLSIRMSFCSLVQFLRVHCWYSKKTVCGKKQTSKEYLFLCTSFFGLFTITYFSSVADFIPSGSCSFLMSFFVADDLPLKVELEKIKRLCL